jgi:hypothetical protein
MSAFSMIIGIKLIIGNTCQLVMLKCVQLINAPSGHHSKIDKDGGVTTSSAIPYQHPQQAVRIGLLTPEKSAPAPTGGRVGDARVNEM